MHPIDISILAAYFLAVFAIAFAVRRGAARDIDSYFLGDRSMRWWLLGASGMASNVDMAGTMVIAALLFTFGFSGFFVEMRGGIVLIMAFFLAFTGKWTRRSGKMTIAEWMEFRFGPGPQGQAPRLLAAIFNILFFTWCIAYFAVGSRKFLESFLPWDAQLCSAALIVIVMIYTAFAGLKGVVWTDVFQGLLVLILAVVISWKAFFATADHAALRALTGDAWMSLTPAWHIDPKPGYEGLRYLGLAIALYSMKTLIDGFSGAGGYMAQRYFAAASDKECALASLWWIVLMAARWPLMMGIAVLGFTLKDRVADPEMVLPVVIRDLFPVGMRGLLIVGLLAAAMSTYSSIMNAGASYFVKDIYQAFIRREAGDRELVIASYASTIVLAIIGLMLANATESINEVWSWLNIGLGSGLILPNMLRWYWWRLNGWGYAAGAAAGMVIALTQQSLKALGLLSGFHEQWIEIATFAAIIGGSLAAMILVSLLTPPSTPEVLHDFYRKTRPAGLWSPIRATLPPPEQQSILAETRSDFVALLIAVPWQLVLFLLPMAIIVKHWTYAGWLALALLILSALLYQTWLRPILRRA
ncbi:MAG: sodium:solute symporter [Phycisphaerae bacterium]|nr:sodium:solute symporter [Phycisphaerae bacterium]